MSGGPFTATGGGSRETTRCRAGVRGTAFCCAVQLCERASPVPATGYAGDGGIVWLRVPGNAAAWMVVDDGGGFCSPSRPRVLMPRPWPVLYGPQLGPLLVSALRPSDHLLTSEKARVVLKVAGHPGVSNRYVREGVRVLDIYINLSDLQPDSGSVWTVESSPTQAGLDCEYEFDAMIRSARITRVTSTP